MQSLKRCLSVIILNYFTGFSHCTERSWLTYLLQRINFYFHISNRFGGRSDGGRSFGDRDRGGRGGMSDRGRPSSLKGTQPGQGLKKPRWDIHKLPKFEKNFYREHPAVTRRNHVRFFILRLF